MPEKTFYHDRSLGKSAVQFLTKGLVLNNSFKARHVYWTLRVLSCEQHGLRWIARKKLLQFLTELPEEVYVALKLHHTKFYRFGDSRGKEEHRSEEMRGKCWKNLQSRSLVILSIPILSYESLPKIANISVLRSSWNLFWEARREGEKIGLEIIAKNEFSCWKSGRNIFWSKHENSFE